MVFSVRQRSQYLVPKGEDEICHWKNGKKKHTSNNFSPVFKEDLKAVSNFRQFNLEKA